MTLTDEDLRFLAEQARRAARAAGALIATSRPAHIEHKPGGSSPASQVVTEIDRNAEALILEALGPSIARFDLGLLTEERPDSGDRFDKEYFWCIDPLDGTLPFIEGKPGYAVSIALVSRDASPAIGVVFDPVHDTLYEAVAGLGLERNQRPWALAADSRDRPLSVFLDRHHASRAEIVATLRDRARDLGFSGLAVHTQTGSVLNACQVLEHAPAGYLRFPKPSRGGGCLWDFAATACLFREAGAVATDIHGAPLDLNRADSPYMNHRGVLFATDAQIAAGLQAFASSVAAM